LSLAFFHRLRPALFRERRDEKSRILRPGEFFGNDQRKRESEEIDLAI
jgi:hypothetical protein